jgi:glutamate racemase
VTDAPIGVFDSGVGGLTVARAIIDQLPRESITYVGDTAHSPYGPKPIAQVRQYALEVMDDLVAEGVKLLVIACNTASAAVLRDARERYTDAYGIPVVEVIQPAVRAAVRQTRNRRIGVIGTVGTVKSKAYEDAFAAASDLEIFAQACPRFVEFVESGVTSGPELFAVAEEYLAPLKGADIDTLVLGCTHYPLLAGAIQYVMGEDVTLVSSAEETAYDVYRTLVKHGLERTSTTPATYRFEATGDSQQEFLSLASRFLGPEVTRVDLVETGTIHLPRIALPRRATTEGK